MWACSATAVAMAMTLASPLAAQCGAWESLNDEGGGSISCVTSYTGQLVVGGWYKPEDDSGGVAGDEKCFGHISRLTETGWQTVGGGVNDEVLALAVFNGDLIAGGLFYNAGGVPVSHIARWDGRSWHPLGSGVGPNAQRVNAL